MKKYFYLAFVFVLLWGCKEDDTPSVFDFDVTISRVESHKVWLDIFPKDEFLTYNVEWLSVEEWNQLYSSDKAYMDELASIMPLYTEEQYRLVVEEGAFLSSIQVMPATDYYLVIVTLDKNRKPLELRKVAFTSAQEHHSDFSLLPDSIRMEGGIISIHPSDTADTYFWDYELKKVIDRDWVSYHSGWFYYDVEYYYQMDFFPDMLSKGEDSENVFLFYSENEIQVGDTICLLAIGYDNFGETSPAYLPFWIIYGGKESASTVVEAEKDGYENVFSQSFISPRRSIAKESLSPYKRYPMPSAFRTDRYIPRHIRSVKR